MEVRQALRKLAGLRIRAKSGTALALLGKIPAAPLVYRLASARTGAAFWASQNRLGFAASVLHDVAQRFPRGMRRPTNRPRAPVRQIVPSAWKTKLRHILLDVDARIDSTLFSSAVGARELYERFSTFMDRFYVGRWKRWVFIEPLSEMATLGLGGLVLMLALAQPAFRETADDDWLKKSDLAVTFLDRYGNPIGSRGI
eukprot:gene7852-10619_t